MVDSKDKNKTLQKLQLVVVEANLTRDESYIRMNPCAVVEITDQVFRTRVARNYGKLPKWNQTFDVSFTDLHSLACISVFHTSLIS